METANQRPVLGRKMGVGNAPRAPFVMASSTSRGDHPPSGPMTTGSFARGDTTRDLFNGVPIPSYNIKTRSKAPRMPKAPPPSQRRREFRHVLPTALAAGLLEDPFPPRPLALAFVHLQPHHRPLGQKREKGAHPDLGALPKDRLELGPFRHPLG
jgi:hypothetical protein